ncbi:MAG: deoxyribodipyrimidine photo-lyase [Gammaproteobacteria bacterium]|nr:deoxyribodipyrimidine photo-lyase [Gammaproteobacteria bacterium]
MPKEITIHWFRQDLRLADNPAFAAACSKGRVLPVYILDDSNAGELAPGAASNWWLHESLTALNQSLDGKLAVFKGDPADILADLVERLDIRAVYWNRCYEPWQVSRDKRIKSDLVERDIAAASYNGSLLWEPWDVLKKDDTPYKVFTPFYKNGCLAAKPPRTPLAEPGEINIVGESASDLSIDQLGLMPEITWYKKLAEHWSIGEQGAQQRLQEFVEDDMQGYRDGRDFPAMQNVSRLSPHLHFGEISPNQAWHAASEQSDSADCQHFLRELGWREFSHNLLYYFPDLPDKNLQSKFDHFPWQENDAHLQSWQKGQTGHPLIDAGMRELWQTGYMHNRIRMVVGSFLVKNLLLDWRNGERWFWDCLLDADLANNSAGWQWIAGCGADAAPYFRVFNPVLQGKKFDQDGEYTRRFVPELKDLPDKYLFSPWEAPDEVLQEAGVELGQTYPEPIVDLKESRQQALQAYQDMKDAAD